MTVDDAAPARLKALRPATDEAIAMFVDDWEALWRLLQGAKQLSMRFPVKGRGTRTATFEVGGLNRSRMRGWDPPAGACHNPLIERRPASNTLARTPRTPKEADTSIVVDSSPMQRLSAA